MTTVLIVDDHALIRRGLARYLQKHLPECVICGAVATEDEAVELAESHEPALVVLDLTLKEGHGLSLVKRLRELDPEVRLLVYSGHSERVYAGKVLQAGGHGYVMKDHDMPVLMNAVDRVMDGKRAFSDDALEAILDDISAPEATGVQTLTETELQILELVGEGLTNKEVVQAMGYPTRHTLNSHMTHIKRKLNCKTFAEVRQFATIWLFGNESHNNNSD